MVWRAVNFISHRPVGSDTLSRWIEDELKLPGIDTKIFEAHTYKSTFISKAKVNGIGINEIMKRGCWKRESAFKNFCDNDIINENYLDELNYEASIHEVW